MLSFLWYALYHQLNALQAACKVRQQVSKHITYGTYGFRNTYVAVSAQSLMVIYSNALLKSCHKMLA